MADMAKSNKIICSFLALLSMLIFAFLYNLKIRVGWCNESALYRTQFGVYTCGYNEERAPNWLCDKKRGGVLHYVGLKKLDTISCYE